MHNRRILNKVEIGKRINEARLELNMSYTQLADLIDVPKGTLNSWVRGLALPPDNKLHKISVISSKPLNWLLWGNEGDLQACSLCEKYTPHEICLECRKTNFNEILSIYNIIESKDFPLPLKEKKLITTILKGVLIKSKEK